MSTRATLAALSLVSALTTGCAGLPPAPPRTLTLFGVEQGAVLSGEAVKLAPSVADPAVRFEGAATLLTGIAVAQLVDRGLLDPDAPVEVYVPELAGRNRFPRALRLRHVIAQTSGLRDGRLELRRPGEALEQRLGRVLRDHGRLRTEPGARQRHARINFLVLGAAIERVSGRRYDQYVRENILDPLELTGTSLGGADATPWGHVSSTTAELGRLGQLLLAEGLWEGRELLSAEAVRRMFAASRDPRGWALPDGSGWTRGTEGGEVYVEHAAASHVLRLYPRLDYGVVAVGPRRPARHAARTRFTKEP